MDFINHIYSELVDTHLTVGTCILRLFLSMLLGGLVGIERKRKGQIAGIRTFALISMGATLAMLVSIWVPQELMRDIKGDPTRIAAQVVSGIGFLGAGAIIQMKGSVRGLTTAAGIWMVAMIGLAVGCGLYIVSMVATLMILFILILLELIEHKANIGSYSRTIRVKLPEIVTNLDKYRACFDNRQCNLVNIFIEYDYKTNETSLIMNTLLHESVDYPALLQQIASINPTSSIMISNQATG